MAGYGDHDNLSILMCNNNIASYRATNYLKTRGKNVQTATLVTLDANKSEVPLSVVWSSIVNNQKVVLAKVQTGPFNFHFQDHCLQKLSTHATIVDACTVKDLGAVKSTRGAMSVRLMGVFQKTQQEQARQLLIAGAPSKGCAWTQRNDYN
jgi:hypothetical protein